MVGTNGICVSSRLDGVPSLNANSATVAPQHGGQYSGEADGEQDPVQDLNQPERLSWLFFRMRKEPPVQKQAFSNE